MRAIGTLPYLIRYLLTCILCADGDRDGNLTCNLTYIRSLPTSQTSQTSQEALMTKLPLPPYLTNALHLICTQHSQPRTPPPPSIIHPSTIQLVPTPPPYTTPPPLCHRDHQDHQDTPRPPPPTTHPSSSPPSPPPPNHDPFRPAPITTYTPTLVSPMLS